MRLQVGWRGLLLLPLLLFLAFALLGPYTIPGSATDQHINERLISPSFPPESLARLFGTDGLGRDLLSRVAAGAQLSLVIGTIAATGSAILGILLGIASGALRGFVDRVITLLIDVNIAVPTIILGIVLTAIVGQSLTNVLIILIASGWVMYARVLRLQTRQIMGSEFVLASQAIGASRWHLWIRHVLPHLAATIFVLFFQQVAAMMIWEASLTYLGIGMPVENISLGGMIRDGQTYIFNAWWVSVFPGLAIVLAVVGFNLTADWLQQRLRTDSSSH